MTKIGVGVGEDFPIEDKPPGGQGSGQGEQAGRGCGYGQWDREDWRARRAEWRQQRREWRAQHRAQHRNWRRRFRAEMRARGYGGWGFFPLVPIIIVALIQTFLVTGLITVVASAPVFVLGLIFLAVLYGAHRNHRFRRYAHDYYGPRDADVDATPTSGGRAQDANPPPQGEN